MLLTHKQLLARKLDELEELDPSNDTYSILQSAAILRQLYLDEHPLINLVNKEFKLNVFIKTTQLPMFLIDMLSESEKENFYIFSDDAIDGEQSIHSSDFIELKHTKFVGHKIAYAAGNYIAVEDVIKFAAHSGGIHHILDNEKQKEMDGLGKWMALGGLPPYYQSIKAIGRATFKGLKEIKALSNMESFTQKHNQEIFGNA